MPNLISTLSMLTLSTKEKDTANKLKSLAKMFLSSTISELPSSESMLEMLHGRVPPSPTVSKIAALLEKVLETDDSWRTYSPVIEKLLSSADIELSSLEKLLAKALPMAGFSVNLDENPSALREALLQIVRNIISGSTPHHSAIVECRACGFRGLY